MKAHGAFRLASLISLLTFSALARTASAQMPTIPDFSIDSVRSSVLGEVRRINVSLPATYGAKAWADERYPVLIILDGEPSEELALRVMQARLFSKQDAPMFPELIIVGVETSLNRVRDMSPVLEGQPARPDRGGAPAFGTFLTDELLPWLASRYRTTPYTILTGHSMTGLFAAWMYGHSAQINAVIALSPSLWWYEPAAYQLVLGGVRTRMAPGHLFVAASNDEGVEIARITRQFAADMQRQSNPSTTFISQRLSGATHGQVRLLGLPEGLRAIFDPVSLAGMEQHLSGTSAEFLRAFSARRLQYVSAAPRFGLPARLPVIFTYNLASWLVTQPALRSAVPTLCTELSESYPGLWQRYACEGEYKLSEKDLTGAEVAFKAGLALAEERGFAGALPVMRNGLARVAEARR